MKPNWYYQTFVKWGDRKFMDNRLLHHLWWCTIGLPTYIQLWWIWYGPEIKMALKEIKRMIKRGIIKSTWWVFPPLGTTLNGLFGGSDETGLEGGYEQPSPDEVPEGKDWTPNGLIDKK